MMVSGRPFSRAAATVALFACAVVVGLVLIEATASLFVPPWPARALRSYVADTATGYNSWGMRDEEHSSVRPSGVRARFAFVGDSFVEFDPLPLTLPQSTEKHLQAMGGTGFEAMNFGVSGTGIESYFYRIRDVVMKFGPDSVSLFFFSGNDFVGSADAYSAHWLPPLIDESPGRSIVGNVMPRTNWFVVNRLRTSEFFRGSETSDEFAALQRIVQGPPEGRLADLVQFMTQHYFPNTDPAVLAEILGRGDGRLLTAVDPAKNVFLPGSLLVSIVNAELGKDRFWSVRTREEAAAFVTPADVEANISWLRQMDRVVRSKGAKLDIFVIPTGSIDRDFVEFWRPWPAYYSWYVHCDLRHDLLVAALKKTDLSVIDLKADFGGVLDTYRKADGHWTERGLRIAGSRVANQLLLRFPDLASIAPHSH